MLVDYWSEWFGPCKMIAPTSRTVARITRAGLPCQVDIEFQPGRLPRRHRGSYLILFKGVGRGRKKVAPCPNRSDVLMTATSEPVRA